MKFSSKEPVDEVQSLLGEGTEFAGDLSFANGLRVDGVLKGKVKSEGTLLIGPKGKVEAEVSIRRISINGEFRGTIRSTERVEIHKEGRVYGDIFTPCLIIEAGALFEGKCDMHDRKGAKAEDGTQLKVREGSGDSAKSVSHAAGSEKSWIK